MSDNAPAPVEVSENGVCIHLPSDMLAELGVSEGDTITYKAENGRIELLD